MHRIERGRNEENFFSPPRSSIKTSPGGENIFAFRYQNRTTFIIADRVTSLRDDLMSVITSNESIKKPNCGVSETGAIAYLTRSFF
jgi:hypothetical protein